jgi:hypothetical protein
MAQQVSERVEEALLHRRDQHVSSASSMPAYTGARSVTTSTGTLGRADGPLEENGGRPGRRAAGDEHVNDCPNCRWHARASPLAGGLHVGLVHLPAVTSTVPAGRAASASSGVERTLGRRWVIDLQTAVGQQLFDVAIGQAEA